MTSLGHNELKYVLYFTFLTTLLLYLTTLYDTRQFQPNLGNKIFSTTYIIFLIILGDELIEFITYSCKYIAILNHAEAVFPGNSTALVWYKILS